MYQSKKLIIVYPDIYEDLALLMEHEVSKLEGFDCTAWSVEHYKQNAPALSGRSYVVFIGGDEENGFTRIYRAKISKISNIDGACHGWDGSKAVVFGEGVLGEGVLGEEFITAKRFPFVKKNLIPVLGVANTSVLAAAFAVAEKVSLSKDKKELLKKQTKAAIYNFIDSELESWAKECE